MITGELKSKVDRVWDAFWSGGIANPLEVIEQITYLLFLRRLDELQTLAERKANRTGAPVERVIFDGGSDDPRRWQNLKQADPGTMFATVSEQVFPWLRTLGGEDSHLSRRQRGDGIILGPAAEERPEPTALAHPDELHYAIVHWIEHTYNRRRRQRRLGRLTPIEYELAFTPDQTATAA